MADTSKGLDILMSLAVKGFQIQNAAFDAVDGKSSSVISYVGLASTILGTIAVQGRPPKQSIAFACVGLLSLLAAIVFSLLALRVTKIPSLPSAKESFKYWDYYGDKLAVAAFIEAIEEAQDGVAEITRTKATMQKWAYLLLCIGLIMMAIAAVYRAVLSSRGWVLVDLGG